MHAQLDQGAQWACDEDRIQRMVVSGAGGSLQLPLPTPLPQTVPAW